MRKLILALGTVFALALPGTAAAGVGVSSIKPNLDTNPVGMAEAFSAPADATGPIDTLHVYLDSSSTASQVQVGVYSGGSRPSAKLGSCTVTAPRSGWNDCAVTPFNVTAGATYWTAILQPEGSTGTLRFRDGGTQTAYTSSGDTHTSLPASYDVGHAWSGTGRASLYGDADVAPPADTPASAAFTSSPSDPTVGQEVTFDAQGGGDAPLTYTWEDDGGDGAGGTQWPLGSGDPLHFTFSGAGVKHVRLTVTDADGDTATVEHDVTVSADQTPPPTDTDGDGTPDSSDDCPSDPGPASNGGCPVEQPPVAQCADGVDNDGDGKIDAADPGCADSSDNDETDPVQPPPTGTCFTSPGSCGFPDPAYGNVGVPADTTLTSSGSINANTPGQVIDGKDITGSIEVNANVTIKNSRITGNSGCGGSACGNSLIHVNGPYTVTVSNVELTSPTGVGVEHAIRNTLGGKVLGDHLYQHGDVDSLCLCGEGSVISDSYSKIHEAIPGDHLENIYVWDNTFTATHNTFINLEGQTANIFMDGGHGNHLTATRNLFAGGGWAMSVCPKDGCDQATAVITDNMFTRCDHGNEVQGGGGTWVCQGGADDYGLFPRSGDYGFAASLPSQLTWTRNVWDDDGSPVGSP
jgi:hypothetical protein